MAITELDTKNSNHLSSRSQIVFRFLRHGKRVSKNLGTPNLQITTRSWIYRTHSSSPTQLSWQPVIESEDRQPSLRYLPPTKGDSVGFTSQRHPLHTYHKSCCIHYLSPQTSTISIDSIHTSCGFGISTSQTPTALNTLPSLLALA